MQALNVLAKMMLPHIQHLFVDAWQSYQENAFIDSARCERLVGPELPPLPPTSLFLCLMRADIPAHVDFASIYNAVVGRGLQELIYVGGAPSVSAHGALITLNVKNVPPELIRDSTRVVNGRIKLFYTGLSLDTSQDPAMVWHHLITIIDHLSSYFGVVAASLGGFGDNCCGQYKSRITVAFLAYIGHTLKMHVTWSFGQALHGKGEYDALASKCAPIYDSRGANKHVGMQ